MPERTETDIEYRLWTPAGFRADDWRHAQDAEAAATQRGRVIVPVQAFLALDEKMREASAHRIGVALSAGEAVEPLLPHLGTLPLIALSFPAFNDGRSYSTAALLRGRHGYRGEIRAIGDILIDQIAHMLRCGFTTFEISNGTALARLGAGRRGGIPLHYQPAVTDEARSGGYSWRRRSA